MNKRGSHVGIVLSFVIFVTFLAFLYTIVEPEIRVQQDRESFLDYLKIELMEEFSANLTSVTVSVDTVYAHSCVILKDFIDEANVNSKLIVKNEEGEDSEGYISTSNEKDLLINRKDNQKGFFKIYNSEEFEELEKTIISSCTLLEKDEEWRGIPIGYSISLIIKNEYVFEKKVIELIDRYENEGGYEALRKEFNIPSGTEFGFSFTYDNGTVIETKEKGTPINIQVREIPMQYVDNKANILLGSINIKIW